MFLSYNKSMENEINMTNEQVNFENTEPQVAETTFEDVAVDNETITEETTEEQPKAAKKKDMFKEILSWIAVFLLAFVIGGLIRRFGIMTIEVDHSSMYPTCHDGDKVLISRMAYWVEEPQRGDIIVYIQQHGKYGMWIDALPVVNPGEVNYIKRVIAVAGDTISFEDGAVYINGELLEEDYLPEGLVTMAGAAGKSITVPEGHIFVMGDNRMVSIDSRSFGCVPVEDVKGKVFFRVGPMDSMGSIE